MTELRQVDGICKSELHQVRRSDGVGTVLTLEKLTEKKLFQIKFVKIYIHVLCPITFDVAITLI